MITELQSEAWINLTSKLERLPHALLLGGTPGIGKLQLAERFAQLLLCEKPLPGAPCEQCEGCRWFRGGNHPDIRYVEPESMARHFGAAEEADEPVKEGAKEKKAPSTQIKIDQTRALASFINVGSHRGGRRVIIVHPAEDMNIATANSLLKMLEEPPPGAIFLLVAHRPAALLPTIRSRCVKVPIHLPAPERATAWLASQGVKQPGGWLAFAGGAPLRALQFAKGDRGEAFEQILRKLAAGDRAGLSAVSDRDTLEILAEVLQKVALDRAFSLLCGKARYSATSRPGRGDASAWLAYARAMGRNRLLTRHPLNTRLFAAEMVAGMPKI